MLAPDCEGESAEPVVTRLGARARRPVARGIRRDGQRRLQRIAGGGASARPRRLRALRRADPNHERLDRARIAAIEPALDGRFGEGLLFRAGRPCRAARGARRAACAHRAGRRHDPLRRSMRARRARRPGTERHRDRLPRPRRPRRRPRAARRQGRDGHRRDGRDFAEAPGAPDPSALAALHDPARATTAS